MPQDTPLGIRLGEYIKPVDRIVAEQKKQGFASNRCHVVRMLIGEALAWREHVVMRKKPRKKPEPVQP